MLFIFWHLPEQWWWKFCSCQNVWVGLYFSSPHWAVWVTSSQQTEVITVWASFRNVIVGLIFLCGFCLIVAHLSHMSYLLVVFSFDRWWVGLYHVWSTGNTGVFCRVAQVSQCGSLSKGVSYSSLHRSHFGSHDFCLVHGFTTGKSANSGNIYTAFFYSFDFLSTKNVPWLNRKDRTEFKTYICKTYNASKSSTMEHGGFKLKLTMLKLLFFQPVEKWG